MLLHIIKKRFCPVSILLLSCRCVCKPFVWILQKHFAPCYSLYMWEKMPITEQPLSYGVIMPLNAKKLITHTLPLPPFLQCIVGHRDRSAGHHFHWPHRGRDEFVSKPRLQVLCVRSLWRHLQAVGHPWWHVQAILHRPCVWHQRCHREYWNWVLSLWWETKK